MTGKYERFYALDGMRGLGALCILLWHLPSPPRGVGIHVYLLVDLFFILSGFVLAHVYEHRMREPGAIAGFLRERVIRLHPLLLVGALPGILTITLVGPSLRDPYPAMTVISAVLPFPTLWRDPLPMATFPLNPPSWSLFWEILTNILFAFMAPWLRTRTLTVLVVVLAVATTAANFHQSLHSGDLAISGLRGLACFPLGVLVLRVHRMKLVNLSAIGPYAIPLMFAIVLLPFGSEVAYEALARFILFPALLLGCAAHPVRYPALHTFSGELSYPIYILHAPTLAMLKRAFAELGLPYNQWVVAGTCLFLIWLIWRFYDAPLRTWLRRRFGWRRLPAARDAPDTPAAASPADPAPPYRE
jgi:peptidoglycan/LPS O-acetylase OafA/YrhL